MTSHICQRVNTGESYIFYFGIFICCAALRPPGRIRFHARKDDGLYCVDFSSVEIMGRK